MTTMQSSKFENAKKHVKEHLKTSKDKARGFIMGLVFAQAIDDKQQLILYALISPGATK